MMTANGRITDLEDERGTGRTVGFVTTSENPTITTDDALVVPELARLGWSVRALPWDASAPEPDVDAVVFRSAWNYHLKPAAFGAWLDALEARRSPCCNPLPVVRWNVAKTYLAELASSGCTRARIPRTAWLERGATKSLAEALRAHDFDRAVVKPVISMSAYETWRTDVASAPGQEPRFVELLARGAVMLQEYLPEVETGGELSFVFFDRRFSHAVLKLPRAGDFRVQNDWGGTHHAADPPAALVEQAADVLGAVPGPLPYARVDGVVVGDALVLMELELIDPVLFLGWHPDAPRRFAEALHGHLG
jgi:glutathione synthase/RimK-type ligase-like ATP-grasp enzyme